MRQKVLYMILAACLLLANASDAFAKSRKKVEDPEITKLKGKIENAMQKVDAQHSPTGSTPDCRCSGTPTARISL